VVAKPARIVLFAVGRGGDPERHRPLLDELVAHGCTVVAPCFEWLASPMPTREDLELRAQRLRFALDEVASAGTPTIGIGHSIGATTLLVLAGAEATTFAGERVQVEPDRRLDRLALMAPATDFFHAPGALAAVRTPMLAWAGTQDPITPPRHVERLREAPAPLDVRIVDGAGHFSFMHTPPPNTTEPLADREAFLARLRAELCEFVAR
jgi:pimeloyl-ACP methyl ester carboxylesterase